MHAHKWILFWFPINLKSLTKRITCGKSGENEWQRKATSDTTNVNEWQQVV